MKPEAQLFCFTYAGGTAAFFDDLERDLPEYEVVKIEYAGHGTRYKEPFYQNYDELADDVTRIVQERWTGIPYALFGYSMGTVTLMEVLRRILRSDMPKPKHLFLAAHEPESRKQLRGMTDEQLEEWIRNRIIQLGAVPKQLLSNKSFWRTYLPIYKADYQIIGQHRFEELDVQTDIATTIFYSETDTPLATMQPWRDFFTGLCEFQRFNGQHFFIKEHHVQIGERIAADMRETTDEAKDA